MESPVMSGTWQSHAAASRPTAPMQSRGSSSVRLGLLGVLIPPAAAARRLSDQNMPPRPTHQQTPPPPFFSSLFSSFATAGIKTGLLLLSRWMVSQQDPLQAPSSESERVSARPVISASRIRGRKPAPLLPARRMRAWNDPELRQNHGCLPPRPFDPNLMSGRFSTNQKGVFVSRVPTAGWGYCHISICHLFTLRFPVSATGKWFTFSIF